MPQLLRKDSFVTFVDNPTMKAYRRLRAKVLSHDLYESQSLGLAELASYFNQERYDATCAAAHPLREVWQLSPMFHFYVGVSLQELGHREESRREQEASRACLRMLLESGEGTRDRPFLLTYRADAYDILRALARDVRCQSLVPVGRKQMDVITSHDGRDTWFDATDVVKRQGQLSET